MSQPLVSIIIPTYNDNTTIERCITSMIRQSWERVEVLVADDGSTDGTWETLQKLQLEYSNVRAFRLPQRRGAAAARNQCFREAQGDILALIDGDMWAPPEWLPTLIAPLLSDEADVTGGPDLVPPSAPLVSRCIGYSMDSLLTNAGLRRGDSKLVTYLPGTGNMAIKRDFLELSGGFDEQFHDTGEDKEWLHRVREAGARCLYLPQALAWHERKPDLWLHAKKQLLSGRRRFDIVYKDPKAFELPHFLPSLILLFLALAPWISALRTLWLFLVALGTLLVLLDCFRGVRQLGSWKSAPLVLFSSLVIPIGYGLGVIWRALEVFLTRQTR